MSIDRSIDRNNSKYDCFEYEGGLRCEGSSKLLPRSFRRLKRFFIFFVYEKVKMDEDGFRWGDAIPVSAVVKLSKGEGSLVAEYDQESVN
ncbi:hypothetical protein AVEN_4545-1 [Araneus ventricosus]|uniref:Uncharacterized protein n=1 Tax=Araneus ventricosus TaxID=182803 RepID=A0A4Y2BKQ6_ARAVE|nr:hypothetical protein AVEN_4545-1 [Araneus ventricosus]